MVSGLVAKKIGMTQIFDKEGNIIPVTALEVGPCVILELKESPLKAKLGFETTKESKLKKPQIGFFKKIKVNPMRIIKEVPSADNSDLKVGQELKADLFRPGDYVDVRGTSVGKGFQGGMKRWHWSGGPKGHGSMHHRRVGSIGASADPSRTFRGTHMPGHMGNQTVTVQNLRVMAVDSENNLVLVQGCVPGHRYAYLTIRISKKKKFKSLDEKAVVHKKSRNPLKQSKTKARGKGKK